MANGVSPSLYKELCLLADTLHVGVFIRLSQVCPELSQAINSFALAMKPSKFLPH